MHRRPSCGGHLRFQSTPPCGGRRHLFHGLNGVGAFQSTPPCGGRPPSRSSGVTVARFQSTPPCGGRRQLLDRYEQSLGVSIHAPVRGATEAALMDSRSSEVSIHAPVRGATLDNPCSIRALTCFNPRPRAGGDTAAVRSHASDSLFQSTPPCGGRRVYGFYFKEIFVVSIHAPVRGATATNPCLMDRPCVSIHAPVRGATICGRHNTRN